VLRKTENPGKVPWIKNLNAPTASLKFSQTP